MVVQHTKVHQSSLISSDLRVLQDVTDYAMFSSVVNGFQTWENFQILLKARIFFSFVCYPLMVSSKKIDYRGITNKREEYSGLLDDLEVFPSLEPIHNT